MKQFADEMEVAGENFIDLSPVVRGHIVNLHKAALALLDHDSAEDARTAEPHCIEWQTLAGLVDYKGS